MALRETMARENEAYEKFVSAAIADHERYFRHTNKIIGCWGFVYGMGALQLEAASFYAWISAFFLLVLWGHGFASYRSKMHTLLTTDHPRTSVRKVVGHAWIALLGWLFLGCVAVGFLTERGFALGAT